MSSLMARYFLRGDPVSSLWLIMGQSHVLYLLVNRNLIHPSLFD